MKACFLRTFLCLDRPIKEQVCSCVTTKRLVYEILNTIWPNTDRWDNFVLSPLLKSVTIYIYILHIRLIYRLTIMGGPSIQILRYVNLAKPNIFNYKWTY